MQHDDELLYGLCYYQIVICLSYFRLPEKQVKVINHVLSTVLCMVFIAMNKYMEILGLS